MVFAERLEAGQPKRWWKRSESYVRFCYRSADEYIKCWNSRNLRRVSWRYFLEDEADHQTIWYFIAPSSSLMHFFMEKTHSTEVTGLPILHPAELKHLIGRTTQFFLQFSQLTSSNALFSSRAINSSSLAHLAMEINGPFSWQESFWTLMSDQVGSHRAQRGSDQPAGFPVNTAGHKTGTEHSLWEQHMPVWRQRVQYGGD